MRKIRQTFYMLTAVLFLSLMFTQLNVYAQRSYSLQQIAGFEESLPAFWTMGSQPAGATLTWATDQYLSMGRSIEIQKSATTDSAAWISKNMCDLWSPTIPPNVDLKFGAFVKTQNVNTNPTSSDQMWWIAYSFYDSAGSLIGTFKLPIDQSQASSSGWIADTTNVGEVSLPVAAWKMIISFVGGKNATGTVWADNFIFTGRNGAWAGQDWNTQLGVPTGWYYWMPPNGGNDGLLNSGFENTMLTDQTAHSGKYSLEFNMPANRLTHDGYVSTHRLPFTQIDPNIKPGDIIRVGVWIKANSLEPDSAYAHPTTWAVGITPQFFTQLGNNSGYNASGNDYQITFPNTTSFNWTQYFVDIPVPSDPATMAMELRLHVYSTFVGQVYFDDISVTDLSNYSLSDIGGFEGTAPAFWYMGNDPGGAQMSWATDQFLSMGHSLKIQKVYTPDTAAWVSKNMCDIWSPSIPANVDLHFGAWVKTQNVNTNPTSNDQRWYLAYTFYDSAGSLIGSVQLPIDQSTATSNGWVADTTAVGQVSLPVPAYKMIISFVGGTNATGTVWADNFIFEGRNGNWAGQDWNTALGVPTGWYYWFPPIGGNDGVISDGFENTIVTNTAAHTGNNSIEFNMPAGRETHDGFVSTHRMPFSNIDSSITPGGYVRVSVWIKANNLEPDSAAKYPSTWSVGITPQFFAQLGNNVGFDGVGPDSIFTFPSVTSFDWTQYHVDFQVPDTAIGMECRLHIESTFSGTVYFDDLTIQKTTVTDVRDLNKLIPDKFAVYQNYPNPFNPSTVISYALPKSSKVKVIIYDMLGREVKTLVNNFESSGNHEVVWNGDNNYGQKVASGAYIFRVVAGNNIATKKMILLK